jgi:diguanylate cyclase (GGDEF)-like protein
MNKKYSFVFIFNLIFVILLISIYSISYKEIKFFSLLNLIVFLFGILLSFIIYYNFLKLVKINLNGQQESEQTLKSKLIKYINEIEKMDLNTQELESVYQNSIKLFESIIIDKESGALIEKHFMSIVEDEIKRASRYNLKFGIIILQIGQAAEIKNILKRLVNILKNVLRAVDVICRYKNGVIILLPQTDFKGTIRTAERIFSEIKDSPSIEKDLILNIGVSCFPYNGKNYDVLIKVAEKNVEQSAKLGGNKVIFGE